MISCKNIQYLYQNLLIIPGALLASILIYVILSQILIPSRVTIPSAIISFFLIFGLSQFYSSKKQSIYFLVENHGLKKIKTQKYFILSFILLLLITTFFSNSDNRIFVSWSDLQILDFINLSASILLSFFFTGYAIISIVDKKNQLNGLARLLASYLLSIFLNGFIAYTLGSYGYAVTSHKIAFITIFSTIIVLYTVRFRVNIFSWRRSDLSILSNLFSSFFLSCKFNYTKIIVLLSLFSFIILFTYGVYIGHMVGDQWYHHGRAMNFLSGDFRYFAETGIDYTYPPFLSALLSSYFNLSGSPSSNSYVALNFLNFMPLLSFYYFLKNWLPTRWKKATLIGAVLFLYSAGFGWIYLIDSTIDTEMSRSQSTRIIEQSSSTTFDIIRSSIFLNEIHPYPSTNLLIIGLPAGFFLLGLVKEKFVILNRKATSIIMISVTILGVLSHDEFHLFVILISLLSILLLDGSNKSGTNHKDATSDRSLSNKLTTKFSYFVPRSAVNIIYVNLVFAYIFVIIIDNLYPGGYFSSRQILGTPLLTLVLSFVVGCWILSLFVKKINFSSFLSGISNIKTNNIAFLTIKFATIFFILYFYTFSILVWASQSPNDIMLHTSKDGQNDIPWYLFPMKFGLVGLMGLLFILSRLFKKFEKEIFIFGLISVVAFLTGPYYSEYRFSKYIMVGMIGFASILVFLIINWINIKVRSDIRSIVLSITLASIITVSGFSIFIANGYRAMLVDDSTLSYPSTLQKIFFPKASEIKFLEFLKNNLSDIDKNGVAITQREYEIGRLSEQLEGLVGVPTKRLEQTPYILNSSSVEMFYNLLQYSPIKYIIFSKQDMNAHDLSYTNNFIVTHFSKIYEDENYLVLKLPQIYFPINRPDGINMVLPNGDKSLSKYFNINHSLLDFSNHNFLFSNNREFSSVDNKTGVIKLLGTEKNGQVTLWSKKLDKTNGTSYIETKMRIDREFGNGTNHNAGIKWINENNEYYLSFNKNGLELSYVDVDNKQDTKNIIALNREFNKISYNWYHIKIFFIDSGIRIYVNDVLKMDIPNYNKINNISRIAVESSKINTEYEPIRIGTLVSNEKSSFIKENFYNYYFLNLMGLTSSEYDIFRVDDPNLFLNKMILVDSEMIDPILWRKLTDFINNGGSIIIVDTNSYLGDLTNTSTDTKKFNHINFVRHNLNEKQRSLNISGYVISDMNNYSSANQISFYMNNNKKLAPYILEYEIRDHQGVRGKIYDINAKGYFDSIFSNPTQYFNSLRDALRFLNLDPNDESDKNNSFEKNLKRIVGDLRMGGSVTVNGSSIIFKNLLPDFQDRLVADKIVVYNENGTIENYLINTTITGINISGTSELTTNLDDANLVLPGELSFLNYIEFRFPNYISLNLTSNLNKESFIAANLIENHEYIDKNKKLTDVSGKRFEIIGLKSTEHNPISLIIKKPHVLLNGKIILPHSKLNGFGLGLAGDLEVTGNANFQIVGVDNFKRPYLDGISNQYITYLKDFTVNSNLKENDLKIFGDLSSRAISQNANIPLATIFFSFNNIVLSLLFFVIFPLAFIFISYFWKKRHLVA